MESRPTQSSMPFLLLTGLFMAALVVCNLIAGKFVQVDLGFKSFNLSAGALPYPITFLVTDLLSEIYGRKRANQVVISGLFASLFVLFVLWLGARFPTIAESPVSAETYDKVFFMTPRVIGASMTAYLVAQLVDIKLFHFWKELTHGKHLWLRNNGSTIFSQLIDSTLVVTVLFVGDRSADWILGTIWDLWFFKLLVALADTPFFYAGVFLFRRHLPSEDAPHTAFG